LPVRVIQHDDVRSSKVDTKATSPSRKKKYELLATRPVIFVNCGYTVFMCRATVNSAVLYEDI
jgi:hypothetical protein